MQDERVLGVGLTIHGELFHRRRFHKGRLRVYGCGLRTEYVGVGFFYSCLERLLKVYGLRLWVLGLERKAPNATTIQE